MCTYKLHYMYIIYSWRVKKFLVSNLSMCSVQPIPLLHSITLSDLTIQLCIIIRKVVTPGTQRVTRVNLRQFIALCIANGRRVYAWIKRLQRLASLTVTLTTIMDRPEWLRSAHSLFESCRVLARLVFTHMNHHTQHNYRFAEVSPARSHWFDIGLSVQQTFHWHTSPARASRSHACCFWCLCGQFWMTIVVRVYKLTA